MADELELMRLELIEIKKKLNNDENYKENLRTYVRLQNRLRYWTDEEYKKMSMTKSINRHKTLKQMKETQQQQLIK